MKHSIAAAIGIILAASTAQAETRNFPVGSFQRIDARGSVNVVVNTGKAASAQATGDASAIERLVVAVEGDTLVLSNKSGWRSWGSQKGKATIAVTVPMLTGGTVSGAGNVTVDRIDTPQFTARVSGAGNMSLPSLKANVADFTVSGAGDITAVGTAGSVKARVSGAGDITLSALKAQTLDLSVSGAGDIAAFGTGTAIVRVSGVGDVTVRGGARCRISKSGMGDVDCR